MRRTSLGMAMIGLLIVLGSTYAGTADSAGTVYYVAANKPGANDSNNGLRPTHQGGKDGPWLTIQQAADTMTKDDAIQFARTPDGGIDFNHSAIQLHVDSQMRLTVRYDEAASSHVRSGDVVQSLTHPAVSHSIVLDGVSVTSFVLDQEQIEHEENISGQFGNGERVTLVGLGSGPEDATIELTLTLELYETYPHTVLTQARYRNLGTDDLTIDAVWSNALYLDRRLVNPSVPSYSFKMVSMGTVWGNGLRDRIWDITADSVFDNYNGGDVTNPEMDGPWGGGGTPITSVWGCEMGMTVAVVEPTIQILGVPLITQPDGRVLLGVKQTNDLGTLDAAASSHVRSGASSHVRSGDTFEGVRSSITVHHGDFFDGVAIYGRMLREMGLLTHQYHAVDYEAYWCTFGLEERLWESPADPEVVNDRLYIPEDLGLNWINIDSGWNNGTGSCEANRDYFGSDAEFASWIDDLHDWGFKVSLWFDPGFGDEVLLAEHPDWFIKNEAASSHIRSGASSHVRNGGIFFVDDWERYAMDPTVPAAQQYVEACVTKLVTPQHQGGWGIDRLFLDGTFMMPPDYSGRHASPHDTERADYVFYQIVFDVARSVDPEFPIEFCPCGGVVTAWNLPYISQITTSDPDVLALRPHEVRTKLYKALVGPDAPVNGDHIEGAGEDLDLDMDYMFPLILGLGDVYQTYYWEDDWRSSDPLGVGVKSLYQKWFNLYNQLKLSQGTYLNLYDLAYDEPGSHAIAKGDEIYYLFAPAYNTAFIGAIELRGLESDSTYEVIDYENDAHYGTFGGPTAVLSVTIPVNDPLLLKATPTDPPCNLVGDLDGDGDVDVEDIMLVASRWHTAVGDPDYAPLCDLDGNGEIDVVDIMLVAIHWGESCED